MKTIITALKMSITMVILCGFIYTFSITGLGQLLFNHQSEGSLITYNGTQVGSELLGQKFSDPRYFHGRVSAYDYNTYKKEDESSFALGSGSANLAVSNPVLVKRVESDINEFISTHPNTSTNDIPTDLLTSSGSGLDPHISPQAAKIQVPAIAKATDLDAAKLNSIIAECTEGRAFGILGEVRVNVLKANIEIKKLLDS
ncbi:MAG TPA: potassium-transporting ATPase subunit KdpC [Ruminiclostridium sp.]